MSFKCSKLGVNTGLVDLAVIPVSLSYLSEKMVVRDVNCQSN